MIQAFCIYIDPMPCSWWPPAVLPLGGGSLPKAAWPILGFLSSCGWCIQPIFLKTHLYITIGLIYICEFLQANVTWPTSAKNLWTLRTLENSGELWSTLEFSKFKDFLLMNVGWPGEWPGQVTGQLQYHEAAPFHVGWMTQFHHHHLTGTYLSSRSSKSTSYVPETTRTAILSLLASSPCSPHWIRLPLHPPQCPHSPILIPNQTIMYWWCLQQPPGSLDSTFLNFRWGSFCLALLITSCISLLTQCCQSCVSFDPYLEEITEPCENAQDGPALPRHNVPNCGHLKQCTQSSRAKGKAKVLSIGSDSDKQMPPVSTSLNHCSTILLPLSDVPPPQPHPQRQSHCVKNQRNPHTTSPVWLPSKTQSSSTYLNILIAKLYVICLSWFKLLTTAQQLLALYSLLLTIPPPLLTLMHINPPCLYFLLISFCAVVSFSTSL